MRSAASFPRRERAVSAVTAAAATVGASAAAFTSAVAIIAVLSAPDAEAQAATCPAQGVGSSGDPYRITSAADFALINGCGLGHHYVQAVDLVLGDATPIGSVATPFTGSYRGVAGVGDLGLQVRTLDVAIVAGAGSTTPAGIFSATRGATISHLALTGSITTPAEDVGALIGVALKGLTVTDVSTAVGIAAGGNAGGLIGSILSDEAPVVITDVTVTAPAIRPSQSLPSGAAGGLIGAVNATTAGGGITLTDVRARPSAVGEGPVDSGTARFTTSGGLIGSVDSAAITFVNQIIVGAEANRVDVAGRRRVGGLIGTVELDARTLILGGHTVHADVRGADPEFDITIGGLVGLVRHPISAGTGGFTIQGPALFMGTVTGGTDESGSVGGAVGRVERTGALTLRAVGVNGTVQAEDGAVGGAVGAIVNVTSASIGAVGQGVGIDGAVSGGTYAVGGIVGYAASLGTGASEGLEIVDARMLASVSSRSNRGTGGAVGNFVGQNGAPRLHLTGVQVGTDDNGGKVTIRVQGSDVGIGTLVGSSIGGMVGSTFLELELTITLSTAYVDIAATAADTRLLSVGGLVGDLVTNGPTSLEGVSVKGIVTGWENVGGLIGRASRTGGDTKPLVIGPSGATPTTMAATVQGGVEGIGGLIGRTNGGLVVEITGATMSGDVTSEGRVGGLVGTSTVASIVLTDVTMSGDVTGVLTAGGFIGAIDQREGSTAAITGGLFSGTVTASAESPGGAVHVAGLVGETYHVVAVSGTSGAGGTVRAVHPVGNADGSVFVSGGVQQFGFLIDPASVDVAGASGMAAATLDLTQVAQAIRDVGRCVVSTTATLTRWTNPDAGPPVLQIRRVDPPPSDPCPEPAGGFGFPVRPAGGATDVTVDADVDVDASAGVSLDCGTPTLRVGATVACRITGGPAAADIVWRAATNPTFATGVVRTDTDGGATFTFRIAQAALGRIVTVELVGWTGPIPLGTVTGGIPSRIPAGDGGAALTAGRADGSIVLLGAVVMIAAIGGLMRRSSSLTSRGDRSS